MSTKAIFFDFDGTLADTAPGIVATMQQVFRSMNLPVPTAYAVMQTIGIPLRDAIKTAGKLTDEQADEGAQIYKQLFQHYELPNIRLFTGVTTTLQQLRDQGLRLAICTSRNVESLEVIMKANQIEHLFEEVVTGTDGFTPKPAPDMVFELLRRTHLQPEEAIVVGDTTYDVLMGNRAHCRTLAVTYGNHTREQLQSANPTWITEHIEDLPQLAAE